MTSFCDFGIVEGVSMHKLTLSPDLSGARRMRVLGNAIMHALERRRLFSTFSVTSANDSGAGSLRQAILDANAAAGADMINFAIGTGLKTIATLSPLPTITGPLVIDGST